MLCQLMNKLISYDLSQKKLNLRSIIKFSRGKSSIILILMVFTLLSSILINTVTVYADSLDASDLNTEIAKLGIEAEGFALIDSRTGIILFSDNVNKNKIYPASTTKIMTAIVALENESLDTVMTASQAAVNDIGVGAMNIGIMAGEKLTLRDLLHALLICSANEAANIIAENVAPSREEFINMMNKRAKDLGAVNTHFVNTNGMHHEDHYTTARDMALIAQHAMTIPAFRNIVRKESFDMTPTNKHETWNTLYTTNKFLRNGTSSDCTFNVIGVKTGFTTPAGHNLVTAATNENGMELISVVLGVKTPRAWEDVYKYSEKLLQYGFDNYTIETLVNENAYIATINVSGAKDNPNLGLVTKQGISSVLPLVYSSENSDAHKSDTYNHDITSSSINYDRWGIIKKVHLKPAISAPINQGDVLGYVEFVKDNIVIGTADIVAANSIEKEVSVYKSFKDSPLYKVLKTIVLVVLIFGSLRFILKRISRMINSRKRRARTIRYSKRLY